MLLSEFSRDRDLLSISSLDLTFDAPLQDHTSMHTRSTAAVLATPRTPRALRELARLVHSRGWPMLILGGGTNTIFATPHFEGVVVVLEQSMFGQMHLTDDRVVRVGAMAEIGRLLPFVRNNALMGIEFMTAIPGTVGGALAGNAGAGNWGLCDFVDHVVLMTRSGRIIELERGDFRFSYRYSELSEAIILEADLLLEPLDPVLSRDRSKEFIAKKKGQPYKCYSSGCVFKNPADPRTGKPISAGMLIDQAGMKNYELNGVTVSEQHANFLVNRGHASGEDFLAMISLIQDVILERTGFELQVEARIVGGPLTSCVLR